MYAAPAAAAATADQPVPNILDLFGMSGDSSSGGGATASPAAANTSSGGGGADLLQLSGNPFANIVNQAGSNGGGSSAPAAALDNGMMDCTAYTFLYLGGINETQWFMFIASKSDNCDFFAGPGSGFFGDILQPQGSGGNNLFSNNMPQPMVATGGANGTANADQVRPLIQF